MKAPENVSVCQVNILEPSAYTHRVLERIAEADKVAKLGSLLTWPAG